MKQVCLRRLKALAFGALSLFWLSSGWGACIPHELTPPEKLRIKGDTVMIVVHQTSSYDARFSTKRGGDEAVRFAKSRGIPLIYLQDDTPDEFYFMEDCRPDHWVFSAGGEIGFEITANHVYIVGGHLESCLSVTLHDIIYQWARRAPRDHRITYLMDAIYSNGKMIDPADPFFHDFDKFMSVVTYGRPGGEHWPKLSLLETMGIIKNEDDELNYIQQILPRWDNTFSDAYRIEVQLNDSVRKVLRVGKGWHPPTMLFHFVDSAHQLAESLGH